MPMEDKLLKALKASTFRLLATMHRRPCVADLAFQADDLILLCLMERSWLLSLMYGDDATAGQQQELQSIGGSEQRPGVDLSPF